MRYIIVEDEPYALNHLSMLIKKLRPEWELQFTADSVEDTLQFFRDGGHPDLCFFDIELCDGNIFELFEECATGVPVIFTTAYDAYSIKAFKANSIGYVLKPVVEAELRDAINKFERICSQSPAHAQKQKKPASRILLSVGDRYNFVNIDDVAWFLSEDKYVYVVTSDGRKLLTTLRSLNDAEEIVEQSRFFRVSRSIICSIESVAHINRYFKGRLKVQLRAGDYCEEIIVTTTRRIQFLGWVGAGGFV